MDSTIKITAKSDSPVSEITQIPNQRGPAIFSRTNMSETHSTIREPSQTLVTENRAH